MNSDDGLCGDDEKWSDEEAHDAEMSERELGSDAEMEREDYYDSTNLVVHLDSGSEGIFLPNRFLSAMVINSTWDLTLTFPEKKTPVAKPMEGG